MNLGISAATEFQ